MRVVYAECMNYKCSNPEVKFTFWAVNILNAFDRKYVIKSNMIDSAAEEAKPFRTLLL